jgi:hypothetical protein
MNHTIKHLLLTITILIIAKPFANAALVDMNDGTIYDTDTQLSWQKDAGAGGKRTWNQAVAWAASLNEGGGFAGLTGWRLPNADIACGFEYNCTNSEMGHLYYVELGNKLYFTETADQAKLTNTGPFTNVQRFYYWSGQASDYWAPDLNYAWTFAFDNGNQGPRSKDWTSCAWAVRPGARSTPATAPTPSK